MFILGLTGQTGAGKSTVAKLLAEKGFLTVDADAVAREITEKPEVLSALSYHFGQDILNADGSLNRKVLAQKAFAAPQKTALLNSITHPAVTAEIRERLKKYAAQNAEYVLLDVPLLFESGEDALCDCTAAVLAPEEIRLQRITARDGITRDEALLRMGAQNGEAYFISRADVLIRNYPPYDLQTEVENLLRHA